MPTFTRHWRARARIAWIACLAILCNALVPLVSHAMDAAAPQAIVMDMEICTAMGMVRMPAGPDRADPDKLQKSMTHCGYCAAHASLPGLPPPPGSAFVPGAARDSYPPLYYHASRPLFPWSLAQPRAPPRFA